MESLRCLCGKIVAEKEKNYVLIKCRHCKRMVHIKFQEGHVTEIFSRDVGQELEIETDNQEHVCLEFFADFIQNLIHDNVRCECGKIIAQVKEDNILIKCRHCKRFLSIRSSEKAAVIRKAGFISLRS